MKTQKTLSQAGLRHLIATTCLTAAPVASAMAGTITEGTSPAPATFPQTSDTAYLLPYGTTSVIGYQDGVGSDWFEFQGLSGSFSVTSYWPAGNVELGTGVALFDTSGTSLGTGSLEASANHTLTGIVPVNGDIVVNITHFSSNQGNYEVDMSATSTSSGPAGVPEPSSLALLSLPVAGALAWRRRRTVEQAGL